MIYQIKIMNLLKRLMPLRVRWLVKRAILFLSLKLNYPFWLLLKGAEPIEVSSIDEKKDDSRSPSEKHFLILVPWVIGGGSFRMIQELMRILSKKGFSFSIFYTHEPGDQMDRLAPYALEVSPLFLTRDKEKNKSLVKALCQKYRPKGVLLLDIDPDSFFFLTDFKKLSIPTILWIHFHTDTFRPYRRFINERGNLLDYIVVVNQEMKESTTRALPDNSTVVELIKDGVDINQFNPHLIDDKTKLSIKKKLSIPPNVPIVSFISRFDDQKNPLAMVEIFKKVLEIIPEVYIIMAGEGHLLNKTKKKVKRGRLTSRVKFLGFHDNVYEILAITSVLVAPSISESFGLSVAEAMAMEIPVVVSDIGGLKELVHDGVNGYRLNPSDINGFVKRTVEFIQNQDKLSSFGKAGRERIENQFSITKTAEQFGELFNSASKKKSYEKES